jgi:hypothetical protein
MKILVLENVTELDEQLADYIKQWQEQKPEDTFEVVYRINTIKNSESEFHALLKQIKECDILMMQSTFSNRNQFEEFLKIFVHLELKCPIYILHTNQQLEQFFSLEISTPEKEMIRHLLKRCMIFDIVYQRYETEGAFFKKITYKFDTIRINWVKEVGFIHERRPSFELLYDKYLRKKTIHVNKENTVLELTPNQMSILKDIFRETVMREESMIEYIDSDTNNKHSNIQEIRECLTEKKSWIQFIKDLNLGI